MSRLRINLQVNKSVLDIPDDFAAALYHGGDVKYLTFDELESFLKEHDPLKENIKIMSFDHENQQSKMEDDKDYPQE